MKFFCTHCGQAFDGEPDASQPRLPCPHCGKLSALPIRTAPPLPVSDGLRTPEPEPVRALEKRRRDTVLTGVAICALLSALVWLFLRPSSQGSAGRGVQNALFGRRATDALQQARQQGQGEGQNGSGGQGRGQQNRTGQPGTPGQENAS